MHDHDDDDHDDDLLDGGEEEFDPLDAFGSGLEPLPDELHSSYSGLPFEKCIDCERPLLDPPQPHLIQKILRDGEVVFEFALCMPCAENADAGMSEESRRNVEAWFEQNTVAGLGRERCNICGRERDDEEHVVFAMAVGGDILGSGHLFCSACTDDLDGLLSEATRRQMEDFTERNFPGVPEHLGLPTSLLSI